VKSGGVRRAILLIALVVLGLLQATSRCGPDSQATVRIYAASSLAEALLEVADDYNAQSKRNEVSTTFGSSATLATQITEGAPASVFISANEEQMQRLIDAGKVDSFVSLATNSLVVASTNTWVRSFQDLAEPGVRLVIGAKDVPLGAYAREAITKAGRSGVYGPAFAERVFANIRSEEANAGAVVAKLQLGEADAAIVYATDIMNRPGLTSITIEPQFNVRACYVIGVVRGSGSGARQFLEFLLGPHGQAILAEHGFGPP
jgi:molybdate transport system substrate-binding protein